MQDARTVKSAIYGRFTVRRVTLKDGSIGYAMAFPYNATDVARVRKNLEGRWLAGDKQWFVPASQDAYLAQFLTIQTQRSPSPRTTDSVAAADSSGVRQINGVTIITD